jgi:hypothetical protein
VGLKRFEKVLVGLNRDIALDPDGHVQVGNAAERSICPMLQGNRLPSQGLPLHIRQ